MPENTDEILGIASSSSNAPTQARSTGVNSPYCGWGGWLAFFCIVQIFVQPIIILVFCAEDASAFGNSPDLNSFLTLEILGTLGGGVFGVIAGIQVWRLRRGAVRVVKAYLVTALVWSILKAILAFTVLEDPYRVVVGVAEIKGVLGTLIPFVIWFSYFNVSKRVKVTFFSEDETTHIVPSSN
jgi:uncharacterized membrane protein